MAKILVECPQLISSVRVGVLEALIPLEQKGICSVRYRDTKDITRNDIQWCDCLVCVRGCEYPTLRIIQAAKRAGRFLVYFLDDDLLEIPLGNESTKYYSDNKIKCYMLKILSLCDVLWAVNIQIIEKYKCWCPRTILCRVPAQIQKEPQTAKGVTHVLYAGSVDHSGLVREKLSPAVLRILNDFPDQVHFTFIGADPGIRHTPGITYYPYFESYEEYRTVLKQSKFTIGLAPSYNTPFYACKYYNKFIEYSSYGIAGIYEHVMPYTQIVDETNGLWGGPTSEEWYVALRNAICSPIKTYCVAQAAQCLLKEKFSPDVVTAELTQQMPEIISYFAPEVLLKAVSLPSMRRLFYQERILLLFRIYGILAIFLIPYKFVRKLQKVLFRNT